MRGSLFLEIPVWPHKPLRCCPIASPPNGTTKKADRDIRPQERPKPTPRRLSRPLEDALSALRRGHGGASSNPTLFQITLQYQCLSRGGVSSLERTRLRQFSLFNREKTGNCLQFSPRKRGWRRENPRGIRHFLKVRPEFITGKMQPRTGKLICKTANFRPLNSVQTQEL